MGKSTNKSDLNVHLPPPGDGVFMFTLLRGKNNEKIQTFIDTGANSVVFKDSVEEKLIMVKISEGPIPVSLAGGKEVRASGEWGALIPLADDSFQAVRGLSMKKIVGRMPDYKWEESQ